MQIFIGGAYPQRGALDSPLGVDAIGETANLQPVLGFGAKLRFWCGF